MPVLAPSHTVSPTTPPSKQAARAIAAEVVVPLYMERPMIHRVHAALVDFVHRHPQWRVRFIDDGSTDGTSDVLRTLLAVNDEAGRLTLETLPRNCGKAEAVAHGILRSNAEHVFYMDGDLAYEPELLIKLDRALRDHDVAIGSRALGPDSRAPGVLRRAMGGTFNVLVRGVLQLPHRDTQAGIKGFRRQAAHAIFGARRARDFGFDAELLFIAKGKGLRVAEVPVTVSPDHSDVGSNVRLVRDPLTMLVGIARIRLNGWAGRYGASCP
jgi:glycosyltransferase involved in cell wall biosynthesis